MKAIPPSGPLLERSPEPVTPPESAQLQVNDVALWLAALGGPVAWAIHLMVVYPLVEIGCRFQTKLPHYGVSALLFGAAALAGLVSWSYLRYLRQRDGATIPRRVRFMARAGLAGAILFTLAIAVQTLPIVVDDPCQLPGRRMPSSVLPHL